MNKDQALPQADQASCLGLTETTHLPEDGSKPSAHPGQPPVSSALLLAGRRSVKIEHNGALYELRTTRLGKLILTK